MKPINWVWQERNGFKTHLTYPFHSSYRSRLWQWPAVELWVQIYQVLCTWHIWDVHETVFLLCCACGWKAAHMIIITVLWGTSTFKINNHICKGISVSYPVQDFFFFQKPVTFYLKFACQFETIIIYMQKRVTFQHKGTKL